MTRDSRRWVFGVVFEEDPPLADPGPSVAAPETGSDPDASEGAAADAAPLGDPPGAAAAGGAAREASPAAVGEPDPRATGAGAPGEEPGRPAEEGRIAGAAEAGGAELVAEPARPGAGA